MVIRRKFLSENDRQTKLLALIPADVVRGMLLWHCGSNNGKLRSGLTPLVVPSGKIDQFIRFYAPTKSFDRIKLLALEGEFGWLPSVRLAPHVSSTVRGD